MKLLSNMKLLYRAQLLAPLLILPACAQITHFKHVIIVVQENRTPDNLFQGLCSPPYGSATRCSTNPSLAQYNIQTKNWLDKTSSTGVTQPNAVPMSSNYVPQNNNLAFVAQCDFSPTSKACKMDGAANAGCKGTCPARSQFGFVNNSKGLINPYLDLATQYGFANYMFQTNQGSSFPAHQFLFGGTSAPSASDDANGIFDAENTSESVQAGCLAVAGSVVQMISPAGELPNNKIYPCFEHQTMPDLLRSYTWRYYTPLPGSIWTAPNAIQHICQPTGPGGKCAGPEWTANVDLTTAGVLNDIAACKLSNLSWVIPTGQNSDHPISTDGGGPSWVATVVNAIGASTDCDNGDGYWNDTAILVTWDDWGGWYDHVPPTILPEPQGDYQYGFRVPLLFISAFTPAGYINNDDQDFGSMLRFVEHNFGIQEGALQFADKRASGDLHKFYNLSAAPRSFTQIKTTKTAAFFLNDTRHPTPPDDDDDDIK
jgi:phospholipase C